MHRVFDYRIGTLIPGQRFVHANVVLGATGAISSQTNYGLKVTKTASETGRYTCQLVDEMGNAQDAIGLAGVIVNVVGGDDAAFTDAKGVWEGKIRDIDIGAGAKDGTVEIQFCDADSGADAEVQDNATLLVTLILIDSSRQ